MASKNKTENKKSSTSFATTPKNKVSFAEAWTIVRITFPEEEKKKIYIYRAE